MVSDVKTHGRTNLCCLKLRLEKALKECKEFGVGCNVAKCLDNHELYETRPFVNIRFVRSDKQVRKIYEGPEGKLLGAEVLKGYEFSTDVAFEIFVKNCRKDHDTFCHASGISDHIDSLMVPIELGVKNAEWNNEQYRTLDMGKGVLTVFSTSYTFTHCKITSDPGRQSHTLKETTQ